MGQARVREAAGVVEVEVLELFKGGHLLNGFVVDMRLTVAAHQVEVGEGVRVAGDQLVDQVLVHREVEREVKLYKIPEMKFLKFVKMTLYKKNAKRLMYLAKIPKLPCLYQLYFYC
jgi:hypothetical protein